MQKFTTWKQLQHQTNKELDFVTYALAKLNDSRVNVTFYADNTGMGDFFPEMLKSSWRNAITKLLTQYKKQHKIGKFKFSKPDSYDDWTLLIYKK